MVMPLAQHMSKYTQPCWIPYYRA